MLRDLSGVLWSRVSGEPMKMGDLLLTADEARFTYTNEYLESGQPGFSMLADPLIWGDRTIIYPVSERIPVFPRLISLIPGNNPRNIQRRLYLNLLRARTGREPAPGMDTEWRLLTMGGHGGIGHVDVFQDDQHAASWYESRVVRPAQNLSWPASGRSGVWSIIRREVLDEHIDTGDAAQMLDVLGPTPTVGGMIPKMLVSLDMDAPHAGVYAPDTLGKANVLLKIEPPEYAGLLDLEALCLDLHDDAGFETPAYRRFDHDGLRLLAVERFDQKGGLPVPMESLFSIIASGNHDFRETGDILLDEIPQVLLSLGDVANLREDTGETLYRRILMALLTGNGDLHLDNTALLGGLSDCRLSPVFDPAPMRAWPRHNLVSAIPFDPTDHVDHAAFFLALGRSFGLRPTKIAACVDHALASTDRFAEQVMALPDAPYAQREALSQIVDKERGLLSKALIRQASSHRVRVRPRL